MLTRRSWARTTAVRTIKTTRRGTEPALAPALAMRPSTSLGRSRPSDHDGLQIGIKILMPLFPFLRDTDAASTEAERNATRRMAAVSSDAPGELRSDQTEVDEAGRLLDIAGTALQQLEKTSDHPARSFIAAVGRRALANAKRVLRLRHSTPWPSRR